VKVLHVVPAVFGAEGTIGGAERYVTELVRTMSGDADVRLVAYGTDRTRVFANGVHVDVVAGHPIRGQWSNPIGFGVLKHAVWADVIHCHQHHILSSSLLAAFGRASSRPVVATDHGGGGLDLSWYVNTDRLFSAHLHVSQFSRRTSGHGPNVRAEVVYGGVDAARFQPGPWDSPRDRVLFVGRVLPHKGVHTLIAALPEALSLDIVGPLTDRRYGDELQALAAAAGGRVTFHGAVSETDLTSFYRGALCIVLPSVTMDPYGGVTPAPELLGQTLLEGMASGLPAVCTDVGALTEVVIHGHTGLVVQERAPDALRRALSDLAGNQEQARRWGQYARARTFDHFSWSTVACRCVAVYRELLAA
jgi:glycosyltransferase involved in cell wall biosynthesis